MAASCAAQDAVALYWSGAGMLLVGPRGDFISFPSENKEHMYLKQEVRARSACARRPAPGATHPRAHVPPA